MRLPCSKTFAREWKELSKLIQYLRHLFIFNSGTSAANRLQNGQFWWRLHFPPSPPKLSRLVKTENICSMRLRCQIHRHIRCQISIQSVTQSAFIYAALNHIQRNLEALCTIRQREKKTQAIQMVARVSFLPGTRLGISRAHRASS